MQNVTFQHPPMQSFSRALREPAFTATPVEQPVEKVEMFPIRDNVMFQFLDATGGGKGKFTDRATASGIIIAQDEMQQKLPRWGCVTAVGPKSQVKPGEYILIEALMWTYGTEINDEKYWKTDDTRIMMVTDDAELTRNTTFS